MATETLLTALSLLSFAALIVIWIAAPLHAEESGAATTAETTPQTIAA